MRNRFLMILVLASLAVGIYLLWFENSPSTESVKTGNAEQRSQLESKDSKLPSEPGERDAAARMSVRGADKVVVQVNSAATVDAAASKPLKPTRVDRADSDLPDDEVPEEFVIGGLVQDEDGNPQSNFEVLAERLDNANGTHDMVDLALENVHTVFSDFTGSFFFGDLEEGEYRVRLAPVADIAPAETRVRTGTLNVNLVVVELRDVRVYGTVNSTDGAPVKDAHIVAAPTTRSTSTGSKGEYELDVNWQGNDIVYTVLFQHKGFRQQRIRISPADLDGQTGDFQLDVSMEPLKRLTSVTGRLTDTKGNPVGSETLHLLTSQLRTWYRVKSDTNGNFLFEEVEPGKDHQLRIRPTSRYKNKDIAPLIVPDSGLKLDVVLELIDAGELSGWMIDLDGHPIPGFSLMLRSTTATAQSVNVVSDQLGFFSVEDFPVGDALFRTNSYPLLIVQGIRVSAEPEEPVMVILDTGRHMLQGRVMDGNDEPVAAASITLDWAFRNNGLRSSSSRKATTDQNGSFFFTGLGPDLHTMQVSAAGFKTAVQTIDVGAGPNEIVVEFEYEDQ